MIDVETYSDLVDELLCVLVDYIGRGVEERGLVIEDIARELFADEPGISDEGDSICIGREGITRFFLVRDDEDLVALEVVMRDEIRASIPIGNIDHLFDEFMSRSTE